MDIADTKCCRGCLNTEFSNIRGLKEIWNNDLTYLDLIKFLLGSVNHQETPEFICKACEDKLINAYLFKKQCLESERKFSDFLAKQQTEILGLEIEPTVEDNTTPEVEEPLDVKNYELNEEDSKYSCLKCKLKFASCKEYQSHYRNVHREKHVCSECGKLVARHNLEKHQLCHSTPAQTCEECGKTFTLPENLKKHIRIHNRDQRYVCEYCGRKFLHWNSKRYHVRTVHTGERTHECTYCGKKFAHSSNYLRHLRYHTGDMFHQCKLCRKKFNTTSELRNHMVTHTKEKNEVCEICSKAFGTRKGLRSHLKTHSGERNYICPVCDKAYTQAHVLRSHLKSHEDYPMPPPGTILSQKSSKRKVKEETLVAS